MILLEVQPDESPPLPGGIRPREKRETKIDHRESSRESLPLKKNRCLGAANWHRFSSLADNVWYKGIGCSALMRARGTLEACLLLDISRAVLSAAPGIFCDWNHPGLCIPLKSIPNQPKASRSGRKIMIIPKKSIKAPAASLSLLPVSSPMRTELKR